MKIPCPRCQSYKTFTQRELAFYVALGLILTGTVLFFLVFPLILIPVGLLIAVSTLIIPSDKMICTNCNKEFLKTA